MRLFIFFLLSACTMNGGSVVEEDLNKHVTCTDTRDGETFGFYGRDIFNIRQGIGAPSSYQVKDDKGVIRTFVDTDSAWLKCAKDNMKP